MRNAEPIDPKHPWIDDPSDLPARMNWVESFFDPTGQTSRVHFTRGWTALFFARLLFLVCTSAFVFIMMSAGAKDPQAFAPPPWAFPALVVMTAIMSSVLHVRRLSNAQRSPLWATLVMIPILLGAAGFMVGAAQGAGEYETKRAEWQARQAPTAGDGLRDDRASAGQGNTAENGETADDEAPEDSSKEEGEKRERGERERFDPTQTSQREYAAQAGLRFASLPWAIGSLFVMLWSLLWVGRLPNGGGSIRSRFEEAGPYEAG
ncbi:MAG: hypothetical protein GVY06_07915 [Alphaproteobacteria bacterium]|jgi:uncharacterized membrane protein YhaH (DUF805 family)|nr:hypothetical protein [Alphaproteobacteria bacterium]